MPFYWTHQFTSFSSVLSLVHVYSAIWLPHFCMSVCDIPVGPIVSKRLNGGRRQNSFTAWLLHRSFLGNSTPLLNFAGIKSLPMEVLRTEGCRDMTILLVLDNHDWSCYHQSAELCIRRHMHSARLAAQWWKDCRVPYTEVWRVESCVSLPQTLGFIFATG